MTTIEQLEKEIQEIKKRNQRVEFNKAWETSWTRRILIMTYTYLAIALYMWAVNIERPWLNAIIPTAGFLFSTLTLPFFKKVWINVRKK